MAGVMAAALLAAIGGFAFSAICGAMLFHLLDTPAAVVEVMLLCSIANQALSVVSLWRHVDWRALRPFLLGGLPGVPLGVFLLLHTDPHAYLRVFGVGLVGYSLYQLLRRSPRLSAPAPQSPPGDVAMGFIGGIGSGFAGFAGGPVVIWLNARGWDKLRQRGVFQPFILAMQILSLGWMLSTKSAASGLLGLDPALLIYLPVSLIGTWCGLQLFRRMTDRQFAVSLNVLMIAAGAGMIV